MASSKKSNKEEEENEEEEEKKIKKSKREQKAKAIEFLKLIKHSDKEKAKGDGTKRPKIRDEKEKEKKKTKNGVVREPEVLEIRSAGGDTEEEGDEEVLRLKSKGKSKSPKATPKKRSRKERERSGDDDEKDEVKTCRFPMERVRRIIKGEDLDSQITQDAVLLVNKATEMFIEQFSEDAYERSIRDKKKFLHYKHLSSAVSEEKRYEFLADFVPAKLKAGDALEQMKLGETDA